MADVNEWIPLEAAVENLGSTRLQVMMLIKRGMLVGRETDGQWYVDAASLPACREAGPVVSAHACRGKSACGGCS